MGNASMTYKEVVDEYKLQITKKDARIRELEEENEKYINVIESCLCTLCHKRVTTALKEEKDG